MKPIITFLILSIFIACDYEGHQNEGQTPIYLPDNKTLWKATNSRDNKYLEYFYFPNDTLIVQFTLFESILESDSNTIKTYSPTNHYYVKHNDEYIYYHGYYKRFKEISTAKFNDTNFRLDIKYPLKNGFRSYYLEQVNGFKELSSDPRKTYMSSFEKMYNDTLVRFEPTPTTKYLIFSHRGEDLDSLTLQPYNEIPEYSRSSDNDTFFQANENNKIYVLSKSGLCISEIGSSKYDFDVSEINKQDSLVLEKVFRLVDSLYYK